MTKLSNMKLPERGVPFYHCKACGHYVPLKNKHFRKHPDCKRKVEELKNDKNI